MKTLFILIIMAASLVASPVLAITGNNPDESYI